MEFIEKVKVSNSNISIKMIDDVQVECILNPTEAINLFRVIQEAIHNAVKHAQANEISILLTQKKKEDLFTLVVKDNGIGFNTEQNNLGFGIKNMKRRIRKIGGKIFITSQKGVTVKITLVTNLKPTRDSYLEDLHY